VLDRGFAVFIEEYPVAKQVLNYTKLELGSFLPGALVKLKDEKRLARVSDPLRDPLSIVDALIAPVGTFADKVYIAPLLYHVRSKTVQELFDEHETDTYTCLREKWGFGTDIIDRFFKPFLEGIYLAPLEEQSSRMFHFVFKMFSEGAATLPAGGIGAVSRQLEQKARDAGVEIRTNQVVNDIHRKDERIMVHLKDSSKTICAHSVVLATDGHVAKKMLSSMDGYESLTKVPENPQRAVGCLYYGFNTSLPVSDPILILSGYCEERGTEQNPINNVCFPSAVSKRYAPEGCNLCSVTVMKEVMEAYKGRYKELDEVVRKELCDWFPFEKDDIINSWELKGTYYIRNAQPAQLSGPIAANINGGRDCNLFAGTKLPPGIVVCGDHMATATLNGALESGINAGKEAAKVAKAAEYEHSKKESKSEDRVVVPVV
jgi:phytoene dehydrogenase-like protein